MKQCDWLPAERSLLALLQLTTSYELADRSIRLYLEGSGEPKNELINNSYTDGHGATTTTTNISVPEMCTGTTHRDGYPYFKLMAKKFPKSVICLQHIYMSLGVCPRPVFAIDV